MTATLRNVAGSYGQNGDGVISFARDELTPRFSGNFLIMEKVLGGGDCTRTSVDGVDVCTQVAETVTLQCKYSLEEQTIADESFDVTGQDVAAIAENTGTLDYTLAVSDTNAIGDKVTFTITPKNAGLVYATIKSCDVTRDSDELTIIGHGSDHCLNSVVNAEETTAGFTSNGPIQGAWTAFKWSTATTSDDAESQGLKCTIGLSQTASTDAVEACTLSNEPAQACFDDDAWAMEQYGNLCADLVAATPCDHEEYGAELTAHCTCLCPSEPAPAEPEPSSEPAEPCVDDTDALTAAGLAVPTCDFALTTLGIACSDSVVIKNACCACADAPAEPEECNDDLNLVPGFSRTQTCSSLNSDSVIGAYYCNNDSNSANVRSTCPCMCADY